MIYWPAHPWQNPDEARPKIESVIDDPMFMGWLVEDEPNPLPQSEPVRTLRDRIAEVDPYRPTHLTYVASWGRMYREGLVTADIVGVNAYASYWYYEPLAVSRSTRTLDANVDDGHGHWITLGVWHSQANHTHPSPQEFRHSVWAAIVEGATGLGFWGTDLRNGFAGEDIRGLVSDPVLWRAAGKVVRSVRRLEAVLTADEPAPTASVDNDWVRLRTWRHEGVPYVLLVNLRGGPERTTLTLPGTASRLIDELHPDSAWPIDDGRCHVSLEPLQPRLLRLGGAE